MRRLALIAAVTIAMTGMGKKAVLDAGGPGGNSGGSTTITGGRSGAGGIGGTGGTGGALYTFSEFNLPTANTPLRIIKGDGAAMWYLGASTKVGRINTTGSILEVELPKSSIDGDYSFAVARDGSLWYTEESENVLTHITTNGVKTSYPVPTLKARPKAATIGPDGNLWFIETGSGKIGRLTIQ